MFDIVVKSELISLDSLLDPLDGPAKTACIPFHYTFCFFSILVFLLSITLHVW